MVVSWACGQKTHPALYFNILAFSAGVTVLLCLVSMEAYNFRVDGGDYHGLGTHAHQARPVLVICEVVSPRDTEKQLSKHFKWINPTAQDVEYNKSHDFRRK
jgi:hypothetical protein